jgi:hypothetical protein
MIRMLFLVVSILGGAQVTVPVGPAADRCAVEKPHAQRELEQARFGRATGRLAEARAEQIRARAELARARVMFEEASLSKKDFDVARSELDAAARKVTSEQAQVALAENALNIHCGRRQAPRSSR